MSHHKSSRLAVAAVLGAAALGLSALAASRMTAAAPVPTTTPVPRTTQMTYQMNHDRPTGGHTPAQTPARQGTLPLWAVNATVVAVPPMIRETSVFGTLTNAGKTPIVLSGVHADVAQGGMLMVTKKTGDGMTGMSMTRTLTVPAGGKLVLSDTGDHLMLTGLRRALKVGERLTLTLSASDGRTFALQATVRKP